MLNSSAADTSEESKQHSREVIDDIQASGQVESADDNKNPNNVAGGLKAYVPLPLYLLLVLLFPCF